MIRTIHGVCFSLVFVLLLYFVRVTYSSVQNMLHPRNKTAVILHSYLPKTATSLQRSLSSVHKLATMERSHYM